MQHICHPFFLVVIFSSRRTINLCRNKSSFTFWKNNFNIVSDKLLGQLLVLLVAKLKTACTKLVYVQRSLSSNLEQKKEFEGDIIRHLLWGRREIFIEFLNLGQPLVYIKWLIFLFLKIIFIGITDIRITPSWVHYFKKIIAIAIATSPK